MPCLVFLPERRCAAQLTQVVVVSRGNERDGQYWRYCVQCIAFSDNTRPTLKKALVIQQSSRSVYTIHSE